MAVAVLEMYANSLDSPNRVKGRQRGVGTTTQSKFTSFCGILECARNDSIQLLHDQTSGQST